MSHSERPTAAETAFIQIVQQATIESAKLHDRTVEPISFTLERDRRTRAHRNEFTSRFGYPVITADAIRRASELVGTGPFVEVGAGNGYLAAELLSRGWTVVPTDPISPSQNNFYSLGQHTHTPVLPLDGTVALRTFPNHNLLWSWPEMYGESADILTHFRGQTIVHIGESSNGCTGGPDFDAFLEKHFRSAATIPIPNFPGLHDRIEILTRRQSVRRVKGRTRHRRPTHVSPSPRKRQPDDQLPF